MLRTLEKQESITMAQDLVNVLYDKVNAFFIDPTNEERHRAIATILRDFQRLTQTIAVYDPHTLRDYG